MAAGWFKVTVSINIPGRIRSVTKTVLVPDNLLSDPASPGNDFRQDRAAQMISEAFTEIYIQAHQKKRAQDVKNSK